MSIISSTQNMAQPTSVHSHANSNTYHVGVDAATRNSTITTDNTVQQSGIASIHGIIMPPCGDGENDFLGHARNWLCRMLRRFLVGFAITFLLFAMWRNVVTLNLGTKWGIAALIRHFIDHTWWPLCDSIGSTTGQVYILLSRLIRYVEEILTFLDVINDILKDMRATGNMLIELILFTPLRVLRSNFHVAVGVENVFMVILMLHALALGLLIKRIQLRDACTRRCMRISRFMASCRDYCCCSACDETRCCETTYTWRRIRTWMTTHIGVPHVYIVLQVIAWSGYVYMYASSAETLPADTYRRHDMLLFFLMADTLLGIFTFAFRGCDSLCYNENRKCSQHRGDFRPHCTSVHEQIKHALNSPDVPVVDEKDDDKSANDRPDPHPSDDEDEEYNDE